jgi:hypothetical protein
MPRLSVTGPLQEVRVGYDRVLESLVMRGLPSLLRASLYRLPKLQVRWEGQRGQLLDFGMQCHMMRAPAAPCLVVESGILA